MQLTDHRILVTGGARGIGAITVSALVAEGARVVSLDVLNEAGAGVAKRANEAGPGTASYLSCDVADRNQVEAAFAQASELLGGLDALVHAAGVERSAAPEDITDEEWRLIMGVNMTGTFLTNQVAFRYLKESGGRILNFGSDAGLGPYPTGAHYSASKGAVMSWTRSVASSWGRHGITVNSIVPAMWTPMYDEHRAAMSTEELAAHDAAMAVTIPLGGRLGDPARDLAPVLVFMLGDGARFMTGQLISINGGGGTTR